MKSVKLVYGLWVIMLVSHCFSLQAEDLVVTINALIHDAHEEDRTACRNENVSCIGHDDCLGHFEEVSGLLVRSRRREPRELDNDEIVVKSVGVSALDRNGHLTEQSAKMLLAQAYSEGKLTNSAFKDIHRLKVTDIKSQEQGNNTAQLFLIESPCGNDGERLFILKGIEENNEITALVRGSRYEDFAPIIYPHAQDGYPQIVFPFAYLSYKDQNGQTQSLSLMNVASGEKVLSLMERFATKESAKDRNDMHRTISEAYFQMGAQMARFYRRYATSRVRMLPVGIRHGDLHVGNIFYDESTKQVTLIDNNRLANSINHSECVWRDFVPLLVKRRPRFNMSNAVYEEWFSLAMPNFLIGFLSVFPASDHLKILEELAKHMKQYESSENRRVGYQVGVVSQALYVLGKNIREYVYDVNFFKRLTKWIARRPVVAADVSVNAQDARGLPTLSDAVRTEQILLWPLIAAGAKVNICDAELKTPLHHAAEINNADAIHILVRAGAEINAQAADGRTPLDCAIKKKCKDAVKALSHYRAQRGESFVF